MRVLSELRRRFHPLHALRKYSGFRTLVRHFDPIVSTRLGGSTREIYCRAITHAALLFADGDLEPGIRRSFALVAKHLKAEDSFWDVGANIGLFTFAFVEIQPHATVVSIEPDEKNLVCLRRTSAAWHIARHHVFAGVAGDSDGKVAFHLDDASGATGSIEPVEISFNSMHFKAPQRELEVAMRSVDSLAAEWKAIPSLMKIDVEGAEVRVLRGAEQSISRGLPVIFLETFDQAHKCMELLQSQGYSFFDADRLSAVSGETTNFLCIVLARATDELVSELRSLGYPIAK
jgi:FkbM family methyltransferase